LHKISEAHSASILAESKGQFFDFDEKKEDEKQTLSTMQYVYETIPRLFKLVIKLGVPLKQINAMLVLVNETTQAKYSFTNWMVRFAALQCYKNLLDLATSKKMQKDLNESLFSFARFFVHQQANQGERYEKNLALVSEIAVSVLSENEASRSDHDFVQSCHKLIETL